MLRYRSGALAVVSTLNHSTDDNRSRRLSRCLSTDWKVPATMKIDWQASDARPTPHTRQRSPPSCSRAQWNGDSIHTTQHKTQETIEYNNLISYRCTQNTESGFPWLSKTFLCPFSMTFDHYLIECIESKSDLHISLLHHLYCRIQLILQKCVW